MNVQQWKKQEIAKIETAAKIMGEYNPDIRQREGDFYNQIQVDFTAGTFPYHKTTDIRAQVAYQGQGVLYDLSLWYEVAPLRAYFSCKVTSAQQSELLIPYLQKLPPPMKTQLVERLKAELQIELKWTKDSDPKVQAWLEQDPRVVAKKQVVERVISALLGNNLTEVKKQ